MDINTTMRFNVPNTRFRLENNVNLSNVEVRNLFMMILETLDELQKNVQGCEHCQQHSTPTEEQPAKRGPGRPKSSGPPDRSISADPDV